MSPGREESDRSELPWWLEPGSETCEFCLHTYHYEAGYYCVDCDRPICPACIVEVRVSRTVVCPACGQGAE